MEIEQPHSFAPGEARERVRALGDYLSNKHGFKVEWLSEDRLRVSGKYTIVSVEVDVLVEEQRVLLTGKDPGMMLRAAAKKYVGGKLAHYLDPKKKVAKLSRGLPTA